MTNQTILVKSVTRYYLNRFAKLMLQKTNLFYVHPPIILTIIRKRTGDSKWGHDFLKVGEVLSYL